MAKGIGWCGANGMKANEMEFTRRVVISPKAAAPLGELARKLDVSLSAHGPYYINLLSSDPAKLAASKERIMQTARVVAATGYRRVVYHPAFYGAHSKPEALKLVVKAHQELLDQIEKEKLKVQLCPENTSHDAQFGTVEELSALSNHFGLEKVAMTIDYSHVHARGNGAIKTKADYAKLFDLMEKGLGRKYVQDFHSHFTGVDWKGGHDTHLEIKSNSPPFEPLAQLIAEQGYGGTIISESPTIEADALNMKKIYERFLKK